MNELEIIKKLEYLVAFQNDCLNKKDWENFDKVENVIKKLEKAIMDPSKREELIQDEKF